MKIWTYMYVDKLGTVTKVEAWRESDIYLNPAYVNSKDLLFNYLEFGVLVFVGAIVEEATRQLFYYWKVEDFIEENSNYILVNY